MNKLQTVLDALESATGNQIDGNAEAIAIVKEMMAQEPAAWRYDIATYVEGDVRGRCWRQAFSAHNPNMPWLTKDVTPLYAAPVAMQAVPAWLPIESAPKDGTVILGYCVHTADPYFAGDRLTDYGARCEGLGHVEDGIHAILWESAREESDGWESPSYRIPAGWVHNADCEQMANPTHWMPLPAAPKGAV